MENIIYFSVTIMNFTKPTYASSFTGICTMPSFNVKRFNNYNNNSTRNK